MSFIIKHTIVHRNCWTTTNRTTKPKATWFFVMNKDGWKELICQTDFKKRHTRYDTKSIYTIRVAWSVLHMNTNKAQRMCWIKMKNMRNHPDPNGKDSSTKESQSCAIEIDIFYGYMFMNILLSLVCMPVFSLLAFFVLFFLFFFFSTFWFSRFWLVSIAKRI